MRVAYRSARMRRTAPEPRLARVGILTLRHAKIQTHRLSSSCGPRRLDFQRFPFYGLISKTVPAHPSPLPQSLDVP